MLLGVHGQNVVYTYENANTYFESISCFYEKNLPVLVDTASSQKRLLIFTPTYDRYLF
jgi:hypothetical protein